MILLDPAVVRAPSSAPAAAEGIDGRTLPSVFGRHPGGVVIVTARGGRAGLTLTSLTSVAAEAPSLSFGISLCVVARAVEAMVNREHAPLADHAGSCRTTADLEMPS